MNARATCRIRKVTLKSPTWDLPRSIYLMVRDGCEKYREVLFVARYVSKPTDELTPMQPTDFEWVRVKNLPEVG